MQKAISESTRRRKLQLAYNLKHKITPKGIAKALHQGIEIYFKEEESLKERLSWQEESLTLRDAIGQLEKEMYIAAKNLHFERAASLRDKIKELKSAKACRG